MAVDTVEQALRQNLDALLTHISLLIARIEKLEETVASHSRRLEHLVHAIYPQKTA